MRPSMARGRQPFCKLSVKDERVMPGRVGLGRPDLQRVHLRMQKPALACRVGEFPRLILGPVVHLTFGTFRTIASYRKEAVPV